MSDLMDLFGDWALRADGTAHTVTVTPSTGAGAWGPASDDPVTLERPVVFGSRLIRSTSGNEVTASATIYVEEDEADLFALNSSVVIDGRPPAAVIRVDPMSHLGMFQYAAVWCE